ncbi:hypothetical protein V1525DRAFT_420713 [Lipomyces kononenkoae]|uniref:Uncharacterized protein n=1 Tax=Lipomyces kononenkoae TaxID=34357 RepID=A0ACC3SWX3_LIPKO
MVSLSAALIARGNHALSTNPPVGTNISLTTHGSDWYWTVFSVMSVFAVGFAVALFLMPRLERLFHYLATGAAIFMALAYFALASNLGNTGIQTEFSHYHGGGLRVIFYARYIGWFLAGPLVLFCLTLSSGMHWITVIFLAGLLEVYIVMGLIGALVRSSYKWGFFSFGVAAWLVIMYHFFVPGVASSRRLHADVRPQFLVGAGLISFIWSLYPICWGLSEGGNVISPTSEGVFYGVLDILTMCILAYIIWSVSTLGMAKLGMRFGDREMLEEGGPAAEKRAYGHEQQRSVDTGTTAAAEYPARGAEEAPTTGAGAGQGMATGPAAGGQGAPATNRPVAATQQGMEEPLGQRRTVVPATAAQDITDEACQEQFENLYDPGLTAAKIVVTSGGASSRSDKGGPKKLATPTRDRYAIPSDRGAFMAPDGRVAIAAM